MQQDVAEESSDVTDGSYTCSPSKQGPLRLKLSSTSYLTGALRVLLPTHNSNQALMVDVTTLSYSGCFFIAGSPPAACRWLACVAGV